MRAALAAALAGRAAVIFGDDLGAVAAVRSAPRDSGMVLLVIDGRVAALDRAMLRAAVAPLAVELAPATRLAALDVGANATRTAVAAAADYLVSARSTTGQVLEIR
ncbi:Rossmann fold domain-containing protein [Sphingomonas sp. UYP23]